METESDTVAVTVSAIRKTERVNSMKSKPELKELFTKLLERAILTGRPRVGVGRYTLVCGRRSVVLFHSGVPVMCEENGGPEIYGDQKASFFRNLRNF